MSVLIKGMEMPKNCGDCKAFVCYRQWAGDVGDCFCGITKNDAKAKEKNADCPLVPVPPHGDLIDRNKLYEKTAEWEAQALHMVEVTMNDEDVTEWRKWSTVLTERSAFKFDIADAPTIIPAEEPFGKSEQLNA